MTAKEYVRFKYPNTRLEDDGLFYNVWVIHDNGFEEVIGQNFTEETAWEDAEEWVKKRLINETNLSNLQQRELGS